MQFEDDLCRSIYLVKVFWNTPNVSSMKLNMGMYDSYSSLVRPAINANVRSYIGLDITSKLLDPI